MPYIIKKVQEGFKVCKRDEPSKCFSKKPLTKSTAKRQLQAIGISEGGAETKPYNMLEIFKGTGSVGKVFKKDFNVISIDFDPIYTPNIETDILDWDYRKFYNETGFKPDFIWASPPCNTFSPLAYPLKERNPQTAQPYSQRAKVGTKILYKTLEIIDFFQGLNPNLLFVIENPRGMMRNDKKIQQLIRNTTLYCLYNDERMKPTDFFSNFPLNLKEDKQCPNKTVPITELPLADRYRIPASLIRHIKKEFFKNYNQIEGKGKISNKFMNQLTKLDIDPEKYLFIARENAKMKGYNPELLEYADDNIHKLKYVDVPFGRVGYNDFIIYLFTTDEQTALNKRKNYRKRAYKVMEETNDKQSPATLAYEILW